MTPDEQRVLAAWSSWGAIPGIFDTDRDDWATERDQLRGLLTDAEWSAASRTTINAHYTDPGIVAAMWTAVTDLGLTEGQVLEPGCGSGTFLGLAPAGMSMTGVEVDPVTARIAGLLYPGATVRAESFADTRYPAGVFDAAVGNVPFANVVLHDRRHNPHGLSMHNHFIVKSLDLVRPGGIVAVLTSAFTLDATNPAARREMHTRADLLGAVRLPTGAHRRTAGTDALTDLLILRRREPDRPAGDDTWLTTQTIAVGGRPTRVNAHFATHPDRILGQLTVGHGMYGADTLQVHTDDLAATPTRLSTQLQAITTAARTAVLHVTARSATAPAAMPVEPERGAWLGMITRHPVSGFEVLEETGPSPIDVSRAHHAELAGLLGMRDMARDLLALEAATPDDTPAMDDLRRRLRAAYTAHTRRYGPINRIRLVPTTRTDPDTGEPVTQRRVPPVMRILRADPFASLVRALEVYDETTGHATPAALLTERVVLPRTPILGVDTPDEAIAVALDTDGHLHLPRLAHLLGLREDEARDLLGTKVFDDPERPGRIVPAAEYLSGNVRAKLDTAIAALADRPDLAVNVAALRDVLPADLGADEITPRLGAVWITDEDYQQFLRELINDPTARVIYGGGTEWEIKANRYNILAISEWGTQRRPAGELLGALLNQTQIVVHDTVDNTRVLNPTETEAAKDKAEAIAARFADWVWEDPARADRLVADYNRRFNCLVLRDYTAEGARLTLPGMSQTWTPLPHQRAAVARILAEPAVGLFHDVGAGKTGEMVIGAMELRRLGMATKPVMVVPNHMLEQATREWLTIYPQARVLAASSDDLRAEARRDFVARVATGDWDGIIMTRAAFQKLSVSPAAEAAYQRRELDAARAQLDLARGNGASMTVKRLEKRLLAIEERLTALLDVPRDPGLAFETTGIDYLIIDEAHDYKNLRTISAIPDASIDGSQRAADLHMKLDLLRARHGERVATLTLATATPIANSITEAHVMTRYLRPDLLADAGIDTFDAWAATFAHTVTELEMAPTGGGRYREKTRFASFTNVPEMLRIWSTFADVQTADDLHLPTPDLARRPDGQAAPETVTIPPTPELLDYIRTLGARADALSGRGGKGEDNMLTITSDGRRAALDMRLVGHPPPVGPSKISTAADRITAIWTATRNHTYLDATGKPSPTPGAFQLVFCDQSTPQPGRWNVYDELRAQLIERGVPARAVRFIHDAATDVDKARLFTACRSGDVAVLIGSTAKMGVGTNVQARAVALHHLDCPWRPADLAQRDGRILRQGNQNPAVQIIRYTTGKSFDAYSWQTVERKAKFIAQVMRGRLDLREIDDIGDTALSLAETKALAADDPLVLDKATNDTLLAKLTRLERAHQRQQSLLTYRADQAARTISRADTDEPALQAAIARTVDTTGDAFRGTINGHTVTDRVTAAHLLRDALIADVARNPHPYTAIDTRTSVTLGGQTFAFTQLPNRLGRPEWRTHIDGVPRTDTLLGPDNIIDGIGAIRILEHRAANLPATLTALQTERTEAETAREQAHTGLGKPFPRAAELAAAHTERDRITTLMALRSRPPPAPHDAPDPGPIHTREPDPSPAQRGADTDRRHDPPDVGIDHHPRAEPAPSVPSGARQPSTTGHDPHHDERAAPVEAGGPRILHGPSGTIVVDTTRSDTALREALKANGFRWSMRQRLWYLPRPLPETTRAHKVAELQRALAPTGRKLPVTPHPDDPPTTQRFVVEEDALNPCPPLELVAPPAPDVATDAGPFDRWRNHFGAAPAVLGDPHWATLADQLDRLHTAGADVGALIRQSLPHLDPDDPHPARALDYAIADITYLPPPPGGTTADPDMPAAPTATLPLRPIPAPGVRR